MSSYTYTTVGLKEDMTDIITNIAPDQTYLVNKIGKGSVHQPTHNWFTDNLRPAKVNKTLEKVDFTSTDAAPRKQLTNYVQQMMVDYQVSDQSNASQKYGITGNELDYQARKAMEELSRDLEYAVLMNATSVKGDNVTQGQFGGLRMFIGGDAAAFTVVAATDVATKVAHGFQTGDIVTVYATGAGALPAGLTANKSYYIGKIDSDTFKFYATGYDAQAGTNVVDITGTGTVPFYITTCNVLNTTAQSGGDTSKFTENNLNELLQKIKTQGASPDEVICSFKRKREQSAWTAGATKFMDATADKVKLAMSVFESDFGIVTVVPHFLQTDDRVDVLEYQHLSLMWLIPFHSEEPTRTGTYRKKVITGSCTMECRSPIAQGTMFGIA